MSVLFRRPNSAAEFDCPPDREKALAEQIGHGVFQTALGHVKTLVRR